MKSFAFALAVLFAAAPASAEDVVSELPSSTGAIDPDANEALDSAERALAAGTYELAVPTLLSLHLAEDRFSKAQAPKLAPASAALLRRAGAMAIARGDRTTGLRAYDAAWTLDGRADPAHTAALVAEADAEHDADPDGALFLARRARVVDPQSTAARDRDESWSTSYRPALVYGSLGLGVAAVMSAVVFKKNASDAEAAAIGDAKNADAYASRQETYNLLGNVAIGVAVVAYVGFVYLLIAKNKEVAPRSPAFLPVLPATR